MTIVLRDVWTAALERIREQVGAGRFFLWFRDTELLSVESGTCHIGVPSRFVAEWLEEHLGDTVRAALTEAGDPCQTVRFDVSPRLFQKIRHEQEQAQQEMLEDLTGHKAMPAPPEGRDYSLQSFVVGRCNRLAYAAALHVADGKDDQLNPLFVHGAAGLGKTHLLRGICQRVNDGRTAFYIDGESFTNQFVAALQHRSLDAFRARFRNVDLLAIDDIHFLADKKATQDEFLHTYDFLNRLNKQVVMASDAHPRAITRVKESLATRLVSGMIVKLEAPDYETRLAILRRKLARHQALLSDDVLAFVAENIQGNVRELEGGATSLIAAAALLRRRIDLPTAREILRGLLSARRRVVSLADIEREVCQAFEVTLEDLLSQKRSKSVTVPRHVAMWLARELTDHSWQEIGTHFNRRNHTAAIFGFNKVGQRMRADLAFQQRVQELVEILRGE